MRNIEAEGATLATYVPRSPLERKSMKGRYHFHQFKKPSFPVPGKLCLLLYRLDGLDENP